METKRLVLDTSMEDLLAWADARLAAKPLAVFCRICGQELTAPESRAVGIGPVCIHKGDGVGGDL